MKDKLLGAIIGLAKATENTTPTDSTFDTVKIGLQALRKGTESEEDELDALTERVREEKFKLVPDCRYCASPCGNTSDYDVNNLIEENTSNKIKLDIIKLLCELSENQECFSDENCRSYILRALAVTSFDWEDYELEQLLDEGKQWKK